MSGVIQLTDPLFGGFLGMGRFGLGVSRLSLEQSLSNLRAAYANSIPETFLQVVEPLATSRSVSHIHVTTCREGL